MDSDIVESPVTAISNHLWYLIEDLTVIFQKEVNPQTS